jgi:hypothetical protein
MMVRQGDVLLVQLDEFGHEVESVKTRVVPVKATKTVVAEGELTGHHHVLHGRVEIYPLEQPVYFLPYGGKLRHQLADGQQAEHNPITLPPGFYQQIQQREYVEPTRRAPARTRRVYD